ncbi:hypothetical protein DEO72_LG3g1793 [Vigna unguiculata]|uniref:Uncharacterized protein n=1 Tax=Vigna unguiculata TaxID=3917 RepID=A0A4D6LF46_VIGUN|nr:hypothetical protein DEO72_LG3g1793 [Vigna unguiculata]
MGFNILCLSKQDLAKHLKSLQASLSQPTSIIPPTPARKPYYCPLMTRKRSLARGLKQCFPDLLGFFLHPYCSCLLNQEVFSLQEDACTFLHKTEVLMAMLFGKLNRLGLTEEKQDMEIAATKQEISQLKAEAVEMEALRKNVKE